MSKWVVDIHGEIEGDYDLIEKYTEPQIGHWIDVDGIWFKCSECDAHRKMIPKYKEYYCPNCGARMVEPQESEEQTE